MEHHPSLADEKAINHNGVVMMTLLFPFLIDSVTERTSIRTQWLSDVHQHLGSSHHKREQSLIPDR